MPNSPEPYASVWEYFRDCALGFLILLGGFFLAGFAMWPFRALTDLAEPIGFCFAVAPFYWFTRRCRVHDRDWYDYAAFSVFLLTAEVVGPVIAGAVPKRVRFLIFGMALVSFLSAWNWLRRDRRDA